MSNTYTLTLGLKTNKQNIKHILKISNMARMLYNATLSETLKRLNNIRNDKLFKETISLDKIDYKNERANNFKYLNKTYGFSKYDIEKFAIKTKNDSKFIAYHLGTHACQKVAQRAFSAVQKQSFGISKKVYFKRKGEFFSFEGKDNKTFLQYSNGYVFLGNGKKNTQTIKCIIPPKNEYINYSLNNSKVKFCRIISKNIKGKDKYYVQLIMEGIPYQKVKIGTGKLCADIGPSTIATVTNNSVELREFCSKILKTNKEKQKLQRKLDRQRRINNPFNYNDDKTIKNRKDLKKWIYSKEMIKTINKLKSIEQSLSGQRKTEHGYYANKILSKCDIFVTEKLSFKEFQKQWGKSIGRTAPSMFLKLIERKLTYQGGTYIEFSTYDTKLSSRCHCGAIKKKSLSKRRHICNCGANIQRDIYSAFLGLYVYKNNNKFEVDITKAKEDYNKIKEMEEKLIIKLKNSNKNYPKSFGII